MHSSAVAAIGQPFWASAQPTDFAALRDCRHDSNTTKVKNHDTRQYACRRRAIAWSRHREALAAHIR